MAAAAILNFVEVKFDVRESRGWPVYISRLRAKFGEDILKGGRVMTIYVFLKWPPSWIFRKVKFEDISVSRTSVFLPEPNFV